jgi:hypothetical protein
MLLLLIYLYKEETMRSNAWFQRLPGALALLCGMMVFGCIQGVEPPEASKTAPAQSADEGLNRRDYLALLKTQDKHQVGLEELRGMVSAAAQTSGAGRSASPSGGAITGVRQLSLGGKRFARFSRSGERSAGPGAEEGPVEIYEFSLGSAETGDEGFVLASNDDRIGNILAIAEGSLEKANEDFAALLDGYLQDYVDSTIAEYNSIDEAAIAAALEKALAQEAEGSRALATQLERG